jgi:hypothetical protein
MDGVEQSKLQQIREDITFLLGENQNIDIALVYSKNFLENSAVAKKESLSSKAGSSMKSPRESIFFVGQIVEDLFDMLPTLMKIQQAHCLYLETAVSRKIQSPTAQQFDDQRDVKSRRSERHAKFYEPESKRSLEHRHDFRVSDKQEKSRSNVQKFGPDFRPGHRYYPYSYSGSSVESLFIH